MRTRLRHSRAAVAVLVALGLTSAVPGGAAAASPKASTVAAAADTTESSPSIKVTGQLPILFEPGTAAGLRAQMGWMVLNPTTRRAYQIFENAVPPATWLQSFDLDTMQPLRRVKINGLVPIPGGGAAGPGDVVNAVDEKGGRLFLALSTSSFATGTTPDTRRPFEKILVLDEAAFDRGDEVYSTDIVMPTVQASTLAVGNLRGLQFVRPDPLGSGSGKLLLLWSAANPTTVPNVDGGHRQIFDHSLAQWDAATGAADWLEPLTACQRAPLTGSTQSDRVFYQLGISWAPSRIYIPCQASAGIAQAVRLNLLPDGRPDPLGAQDTFPLPRRFGDALVDQGSERMYFRAVEGGTSWWVFDGRSGSWVGGLGAAQGDFGLRVSAGLDPATGRFYNLVPDHVVTEGKKRSAIAGGLRVTDGRLNPEVPQLQTVLPGLAYPAQMQILVDPENTEAGRARRVFVRRGSFSGSTCFTFPDTSSRPCDPMAEDFYTIVEDTVPVARTPSLGDIDRENTIDVAEVDGVTGATFDGGGSGFGTRVIFTGGLAAATSRDLEAIGSACLPSDRVAVAGAVESARLTSLVAAARAVGLQTDAGLRNDLATPASRCAPNGSPDTTPLDSVTVADLGDSAAECAGDAKDEAPAADPGRDFTATAVCGQALSEVDASASGALAPTRGMPVPQVTVASSFSKVSVRRDPERGVVTTVEAVARGIDIPGIGSIGVVRTEAESVAAGRKGTAKTTFKRTICGVALPGSNPARCFTDAEQSQLAASINRALGGRAQVRLRQPDPELAAGSPGGFQAAIQRNRLELFTDSKISRDLSTAVPGLELLFYRDDPVRGAGRQIFQFAGVQASTSYGIFCLLGPSPDGKACNQPPNPDPANLKISLADDGVPPNPLAGGLFKVYSDDGDGVVGEADNLIDGGSCLTTADSVGNCEFKGLEPGSYVIEQTKAPVGYQAAEPFAVELASGNTRTVEFTNLLAVGVISMSLTDDSNDRKPLAGGVFEVYADDGDEKKGDGDLRYAACTTDERGNCRMALEPGAESVAPEGEEPVICLEASGVCLLAVPLGPYVVHQAAAPNGYVPAKDVGFSLNQPGDLALLSFANGLKAIPGSSAAAQPTEPAPEAEPELEAEPEPEPEPAVIEATPEIPGAPAVPPTESVVFESFAEAPGPIVSTTPAKGGGLAREVLGLPAKIIEKGVQGLKLLFSSPRELGLMATVWLLVWAPCYLGERRRLAARLTPTTAGVLS